MKFAVGGCAYRSMVSTFHLRSVVELLQAVVQGGPEPIAFHYLHTSNLPQGRCQWLRTLMAIHADFAISIDSDTQFDGGRLYSLLDAFALSRAAIGIVPMVIGGTGDRPVLNVNEIDSQNVNEIDSQARIGNLDTLGWHDGLCRVASGGFGLAVFNLHWFRQRWPNVSPEGITFTRGEDIAMCDGVRSRGGLILAMQVDAVHHDVMVRPGQGIHYDDSDGKAHIS
jgi:hypothetical protein